MTGGGIGGVGGRRVRRARGEWGRYATYLREAPELTLSWRDAATGARGWLVINTSRGGAAGGGTRMRPGVTPREVTYLAKAMELKFALSGPAIGGAKSGIAFEAGDARKSAVLERFYRSIEPMLRTRYGTGGDLGVDETVDVLPAFERIGVRHPQEGVVRGHLRPQESSYADVMDRLERGVTLAVHGAHAVDGVAVTVSDMVTGYGVAEAVARLLEREGRGLEGARVLVEGFGNVGASCALYLARAGARVVAVRDAQSVLVAPAGLCGEEVESLFRHRRDKLLPQDDARITRDASAFWTDADVFVCAALSETVTPETLDRLAAKGVRVIACGANQPFREAKIGSTRVAQHADRRFSVLPDIVTNCGMARALSYLMEPAAVVEAERIFGAVRSTIADTLDEVLDRAGGATTLLAATVGLALDRIACH